MFQIKLFDSIGQEINVGDILHVTSRSNKFLSFYVRVAIINGVLVPFNYFAYDRMEKVNTVPDGLKQTFDHGTDVWVNLWPENIPQDNKERFEKWYYESLIFQSNPLIKFIPNE